jgi:hypothetical protein
MDISINGLEIVVKGSVTFPNGFSVTQFADDSDPFDLPDITIADTGMGASGDLVSWSTPVPIDLNISVIPNSDDDANLAILFEANRAGKNKRSAKDVITVTGIYPGGKKITMTNGVLILGAPANSGTSSGRMRSKTYGFRFENKA